MNERVWVFHRGALGDSVLVWPMLRMLREGGASVTFVADGAKARLAARELGVEGVDAEQRRFAGLWVDGPPTGVVAGVTRVVSFVADRGSPVGRVWVGNARSMFPGAAVECVPGPIDRVTAMRLACGGGAVEPKNSPEGPVVFHVGAGGDSKRWPMERWEALRERLRGPLAAGGAPAVIAGETEIDRFGAEERSVFDRLGGRYLGDLADLAQIIGSASVFVGGDTGPTHLAAQLGVATVALFGPTDPRRWAPIGPHVMVAAPPSPRAMDWLTVETALEQIGNAGGLGAVAGP